MSAYKFCGLAGLCHNDKRPEKPLWEPSTRPQRSQFLYRSIADRSNAGTEGINLEFGARIRPLFGVEVTGEVAEFAGTSEVYDISVVGTY